MTLFCQSNLNSAAEFCQLIKKDRYRVFLEGWAGGRQRALTIEGMLEFEVEIAVMGPDRGWRVNVRRDMGKIVAVPLRLRGHRGRQGRLGGMRA